MLKEEFDRPDGLADPGVYILDPACGTSTFLFEVIKHIYEHLQGKGQAGVWDNYVEEHLLPRLFGFELLMAPYAIAHLKLSLLLKELGYKFKSDERINIYLTNSLEEAMKKSQVFFARFISEEANTAAAIKKDLPIMVVLGNPPYSGISANRGDWITALLRDYYQVDGKPLGEKKTWLQDDYVKFIRFAQWRIEQTGHGIVGYISNHAYLDNPTFRGMRQSLMKTFDTIDLLDLHGNARKKEVCPDGSKDENVFDIQQGVSVGIFTRLKEHTGKSRVRHGDLWGLRKDKHAALWKLGPKSRHLKVIKPKSPSYFFIRRDERLLGEYQKGWPVSEIFNKYVTGIVTARDRFVIDFDKKALRERIQLFRDSNLGDKEVQEALSLSENYAWRVSKARKELMEVKDWQKQFEKVLYRPFDIRHIYYHPSVVWRTREKVMQYMLAGNK